MAKRILTVKVARNSVTGKFVKQSDAKRNPKTTKVQRIKRPTR